MLKPAGTSFFFYYLNNETYIEQNIYYTLTRKVELNEKK